MLLSLISPIEIDELDECIIVVILVQSNTALRAEIELWKDKGKSQELQG